VAASRWEALLFAVLLLGQLLPIWLFADFPSQDGPAHVETARVLHDLVFPISGPAAALTRQYYQLNPRPVPNFLGHAIMAALMLVARPLVAEKILLSLYVLLLPLAARYALRAVRPENGFLAILIFPLVYNPLLQMGFYNFSLGLIGVLWMVGYWLRHAQNFTAAKAAILGVAVTLTYFSHLFCLGLGAAALGMLVLWFLTWKRAAQWKQICAWTAAAFVPTIILGGWVALSHRAQAAPIEPPPPTAAQVLAAPPTHEIPTDLQGMRRRLYRLTHYDLFAAEASQVLLSTSLVWTLGLLLIWGLRRRPLSAGDGLLGAAAALGIIYLAGRGGRLQAFYFEPRMLLGIVLMLLLWLGAAAYGWRSRTTIQFIGLILTTAFLTSNLLRFARLQPCLAACDSAAEYVDRGSVVLPLVLAPQGWDADGRPLSSWLAVCDHIGSHLTVDRACVNLNCYQSDRGYFPTAYRASLDPKPNLLDRDCDFLNYPSRTGGRVDAVVLYGPGDAQSARPLVQSIFRQLDKGYKLAYESQNKLVRVYRPKDEER
jgi:hypothetical protein